MKTYGRKKLGEQKEVILDLNELCRLCMGKRDELVSIFNNEDTVPLTLRIMACVALEVFEGDGLPDKICLACKYQLEISYNFRKKCESSDLKLRQHVKYLQEKLGDLSSHDTSGEKEADTSKNDQQQEENEDSQPEATIEEDIAEVTEVTYIQPEPEEDPESITLPVEEELVNKEACTLRTSVVKDEIVEEMETTEQEQEDMEGVMVMDDNAQDGVEDGSLDAIAQVVKSTLASQPGLNLSGEMQLKVNQVDGKATQVEVTTADGSVIVMELLTEEVENQTQDNVSAEEFTEDGELKIFKCPDCPKSFSRRIQLRRHASVHIQQRGFSCGICEKWFPTRSALVRHERIHTGERPFQCEVCQKSFAQKEILFRHLMTHSGQKPYNCPHCPKGFTQKEPLRTHMRLHMTAPAGDIQLHYCSLCPKVFCHASGLSRHLVTHTGKTFKCRDCDKSFTDKSSLRRHLRQSLHQPRDV